jgi:hypothetical protein
MKLTKQEMYAFPTACVDIYGESVSHSTFYAHLVQLMVKSEIPMHNLFQQFCAIKQAEEEGDPIVWDGIIERTLVKPLEEKGFVLDSYNYEVFMMFVYDYIYVVLELGR